MYKRQVHPFPSTRDIIQSIPHGCKWFAKLDAVHGYFQLALDEESSFITTFLLPQGKFRYLRAPMGLNASSDEWCCHSDRIITGLPWTKKIVDDTLIWAEDLATLKSRIQTVLNRCRELNVTISRKKFEIGASIEFAGHIVSDKGIRPDDEKYKAVTDFPRPTSVSTLRSFLGLAQQLGSFIPDLSHMLARMRLLLKKGTAWVWLPEHENDFALVKEKLTTKTMVKPFNPDLTTILLTDASRLFGLGFCLVQQDAYKNLILVQCGSCSLTPAQQRYATIELELMAIQWATMKCDYYLRGLPTFQVWTDHRPLIGIFKQCLTQIDNPRLLRMREKLMPYSFSSKWVPGKDHKIADALSRFPVFSPDASIDVPVAEVMQCQCTYNAAGLDVILRAVDKDYKLIISAIMSKQKRFHEHHPINLYKNIIERLSIDCSAEEPIVLLDSTRIIVPLAARQAVIESLHICLLYTSPSPRD